MIRNIAARVRCLFGEHAPSERTYTSLATSTGLHLHPECCKDGFIRMRRVRCDVCGADLDWHPVEYAHD